MTVNIIRRAIVDKVVRYLYTDDIIVVHGARQVGKTFLLRYLEEYLRGKKEAVYYIDLEDSRYVKILDAGYEQFLLHLREEGFDPAKRVFVFVDEIQYLQNPSSFMKLIAGHHKNVKLIVSGSSSFEIKSKFKDSLVGRTIEFEMFNLSFEEFLLFKGRPFTKGRSGGMTANKTDELKGLYKEYTLYGGYPKVVLAGAVARKEDYLQQIIDTYLKKDIRDLADIKDIGKFNSLLEVLASQSGQILNVTELSNTCRIAKQTVEKYLFIMENTYIVKLVRPYSKNIRSEIFKAPKIFFYDSGLMQMLWLKSLQKEIIGAVFETIVFSELVKRYSKNSVYYWRTMDKKEIDFILRIKNDIFPIEAKINFERFNPSAVHYFNEKYKGEKYTVAGLNGDKKNRFYAYPWELCFDE